MFTRPLGSLCVDRTQDGGFHQKSSRDGLAASSGLPSGCWPAAPASQRLVNGSLFTDN